MALFHIYIVSTAASGGKNALPLEQLLRHLHINIMSKKNKNVDSLHLAAEVTSDPPKDLSTLS